MPPNNQKLDKGGLPSLYPPWRIKNEKIQRHIKIKMTALHSYGLSFKSIELSVSIQKAPQRDFDEVFQEIKIFKMIKLSEDYQGNFKFEENFLAKSFFS